MSESRIELSVLIATHNRRAKLRTCLQALDEQSQDAASFEVLIADDGSSDGTGELLAGLATRFRLRHLKLAKCGKSAALNAAIEAADGSVCLLIDDDIIGSPELVAAHLAAHREEPRTLGIGAIEQQAPRRADRYAKDHARRWNERFGDLATGTVDWADCYGGNFSAPTASLRRIGGFAEYLAAIEDIEIGYRLQQAGCLPRFLPAASGLHDDYKDGARILADEERFGSFCPGFSARHADAAPRLLGWFEATTARELTLRRALLVLGFPPRPLAAVGRLLPGRHRRLWFGFVSRYTFWRGVRQAMGRDAWHEQVTRGVPVLMYHAFGEEEDRYVTSSSSFRRQLTVLRLLGYRTISFGELGAILRERRRLPRRTAVITIDDGYRDVHEIAFPALRRHRFGAIVNLVSDKLGGRNDWGDRGAVDGRPLLGRGEIAEMRAAGIEFGAHTRHHPRLPSLGDEEVAAEIGGSRREVEELLGEPVESFFYPYGLLDERAVAAVAAAGFEAAATTEERRARAGDDPLLIPRIEVEGSDTIARFLRKIWIGGN